MNNNIINFVHCIDDRFYVSTRTKKIVIFYWIRNVRSFGCRTLMSIRIIYHAHNTNRNVILFIFLRSIQTSKVFNWCKRKSIYYKNNYEGLKKYSLEYGGTSNQFDWTNKWTSKRFTSNEKEENPSLCSEKENKTITASIPVTMTLTVRYWDDFSVCNVSVVIRLFLTRFFFYFAICLEFCFNCIAIKLWLPFRTNITTYYFCC